MAIVEESWFNSLTIIGLTCVHTNARNYTHHASKKNRSSPILISLSVRVSQVGVGLHVRRDVCRQWKGAVRHRFRGTVAPLRLWRRLWRRPSDGRGHLARRMRAGLFGVAALGLCDVFYARHTKARWFALHVIANGWIALLCLPDLFLIATDPLRAMTVRETVNHWPTSLVFSVHVYHMLFFSNLQFIDWLHHILMVVIGAPLLITGEMGHLMNFNHFFMCGLPGGADYAMLFAVKHGWMQPLTEKRINAAINVWVREPALVVTATLGFIQMHTQNQAHFGWGIGAVRIFLMLLAMWNGNCHSPHKQHRSSSTATALTSSSSSTQLQRGPSHTHPPAASPTHPPTHSHPHARRAILHGACRRQLPCLRIQGQDGTPGLNETRRVRVRRRASLEVEVEVQRGRAAAEAMEEEELQPDPRERQQPRCYTLYASAHVVVPRQRKRKRQRGLRRVLEPI